MAEEREIRKRSLAILGALEPADELSRRALHDLLIMDIAQAQELLGQVGRLGDGFYGPEYLEVLKRHHVRCDAVDIVPGAYPGSAFVSVNGERTLIACAATTTGTSAAPIAGAACRTVAREIAR